MIKELRLIEEIFRDYDVNLYVNHNTISITRIGTHLPLLYDIEKISNFLPLIFDTECIRPSYENGWIVLWTTPEDSIQLAIKEDRFDTFVNDVEDICKFFNRFT